MATTSPPPVSAAPPEPDAVSQTLALLQPWIDFVPRQQRRLGVFIFIALAVHIATFFFIRIDTTRPQWQHPARSHVMLETARPAVEAGTASAFWDRLTDPRVFLMPQTPLTDTPFGETPLVLSMIDAHLGSQQLPAAVPPPDYPFVQAAEPSVEQQVQAAMQPPRQPFSYDERAPVVATKTTWQWDADLAARKPMGVPDLPSPVSETDLSPTELRLAVDRNGTVERALLEQTCQEPELDRQAILAARKIRFAPADQPGLTWGRITVFWHFTAPPGETAAPPPAGP